MAKEKAKVETVSNAVTTKAPKSTLKRLMEKVYQVDALLTTGEAGGFLANKIFGSRISACPKTNEAIDVALNDEGNFDALLTIFQRGGTKSEHKIAQLQGVHNALVKIHFEYARQYRNYFFSQSGLPMEKMYIQLTELLGEVAGKEPAIAWQKIEESGLFPIQRSLRVCFEVQSMIDALAQKGNLSRAEASSKAYDLYALEMISSNRLPGTVTVHLQERLRGLQNSIVSAIEPSARYHEEMIENNSKYPSAMQVTCIVFTIILALIFIGASSKKPSPLPQGDTLNSVAEKQLDVFNNKRRDWRKK